METLLEKLAEIGHEQWMGWAKNISDTESISAERLNRWADLYVPYSELTEEMKDQDRKYADKVIEIVKASLLTEIEGMKKETEGRYSTADVIIISTTEKGRIEGRGYNQAIDDTLSLIRSKLE